MYLIVLVMIQTGQHKIASDQILYPSMEMCEAARSVLVMNLENTKPSDDAVVFSKCTMLSFDENKSKVNL